MRKERIYFLLMKPFTKKLLKNFYKYGFYLLLALFISGIIFTSIKYPPKYPLYQIYPTTPYNPGA